MDSTKSKAKKLMMDQPVTRQALLSAGLTSATIRVYCHRGELVRFPGHRVYGLTDRLYYYDNVTLIHRAGRWYAVHDAGREPSPGIAKDGIVSLLSNGFANNASKQSLNLSADSMSLSAIKLPKNWQPLND